MTSLNVDMMQDLSNIFRKYGKDKSFSFREMKNNITADRPLSFFKRALSDDFITKVEGMRKDTVYVSKRLRIPMYTPARYQVTELGVRRIGEWRERGRIT